ncbi:hypothetical protein D3C87_1350610 [compost metagenome]
MRTCTDFEVRVSSSVGFYKRRRVVRWISRIKAGTWPFRLGTNSLRCKSGGFFNRHIWHQGCQHTCSMEQISTHCPFAVRRNRAPNVDFVIKTGAFFDNVHLRQELRLRRALNLICGSRLSLDAKLKIICDRNCGVLNFPEARGLWPSIDNLNRL